MFIKQFNTYIPGYPGHWQNTKSSNSNQNVPLFSLSMSYFKSISEMSIISFKLDSFRFHHTPMLTWKSLVDQKSTLCLQIPNVYYWELVLTHPLSARFREFVRFLLVMWWETRKGNVNWQKLDVSLGVIKKIAMTTTIILFFNWSGYK